MSHEPSFTRSYCLKFVDLVPNAYEQCQDQPYPQPPLHSGVTLWFIPSSSGVLVVIPVAYSWVALFSFRRALIIVSTSEPWAVKEPVMSSSSWAAEPSPVAHLAAACVGIKRERERAQLGDPPQSSIRVCKGHYSVHTRLEAFKWRLYTEVRGHEGPELRGYASRRKGLAAHPWRDGRN